MTDEPKKPFIVHCGDCGHEWAAAYAPMELAAFAKVALSAGKYCPMCASDRVFCGPAAGSEGGVG